MSLESNQLIPMAITSTDVKVDMDRKVLYRKIHKYGKKEYLIELSRTKTKYFIVSIRLNKNQKTQVLQYHFKQGKKLIKAAGGIEALADKIQFKYGSLSIQDLNKMLYETQNSKGSPGFDSLGIKKSRVQSKLETSEKMLSPNSESSMGKVGAKFVDYEDESEGVHYEEPRPKDDEEESN